MALYRGKYILEGLDSIPPEMEADLDLAYRACEELAASAPCEMCGRCCHQPFITIRGCEVERLAERLGMEVLDFVDEYLYSDGGRWFFSKTDPCAFLGPDGRCAIWDARPEICREFPYMVSMFMSRVYLAIVHPEHPMDLSYMDDSWPCTRVIKSGVGPLVERAREERARRLAAEAALAARPSNGRSGSS